MQAKNVDLLSFDHGLSLIFKTKTIIMIIHLVIPGTLLNIIQISLLIVRIIYSLVFKLNTILNV